MTVPEFSPGPWSWNGEPDNIHVTLADENMRVCFLSSNGPTEANANLISSAPELYEALKRILPPGVQAIIEKHHRKDCDCNYCFACAALSKAEGK
jgi:hypothetical protein